MVCQLIVQQSKSQLTIKVLFAVDVIEYFV